MTKVPSPRLRARSRSEWRRWLARNHASKKQVWLVAYTKASGKRFVAYGDAVDEALCFGWIDSVVKSIGDGARAQRYTPRRAGSPVSELNRARVRRLAAAGRMTQAGLDALPDVEAWLDPPPVVVPRDIERALRRGGAWQNFASFDDEYRRIRVFWVDAARERPDEFNRRLRNLVSKSAAGKRFGMMPS
jgi:uncharacterized protein YdeI (YjbR/CyaY-like superfamily)